MWALLWGRRWTGSQSVIWRISLGSGRVRRSTRRVSQRWYRARRGKLPNLKSVDRLESELPGETHHELITDDLWIASITSEGMQESERFLGLR